MSLKNRLIFFSFCLVIFSFQKTTYKVEDDFTLLKEKRLEVLQKNKIGKTFKYDFTKQEGCNKTELAYLGIVTTDDERKFKLLNSFFVTGYSCRGISRLVVYDTNNVYLGNYYMEMPDNLPDALRDHRLVYIKEINDSKGRKGTSISFKNGLPHSFHLPFSGNDFSFQGDE